MANTRPGLGSTAGFASAATNSTISGNLEVGGNSTISGNLEVGGNATVSGNVTSSGIRATGCVLDVQQTVYEATVALSAPSGGWGSNFSEIDSSFRCSLTPKSSSNKILARLVTFVGSGYWTVRGKVQRSTDGGSSWTDVGVGTGPIGNRLPCGFQANRYDAGSAASNIYDVTPVFWEFLDSPNTTSTCTYRVVVAGYLSYTVTVNTSVADANATDQFGRPLSTITLMEIGG